jgi:hypothetical protein
VAGLRAEDLQRVAVGPGSVQPQIQRALTFGKTLGGSGFQRLQLGLAVGRTKMLDRA